MYATDSAANTYLSLSTPSDTRPILLVTSNPTFYKAVLDVNCSFGLDRFASLDNDSGNYVKFTVW